MNAHVVIIGSGPGGYVAAIRASQLGKKVLIIDDTPRPGGVCLNRGCIPSKALIHAADTLHTINEDAPKMGINIPKATIDPVKLQAWKEDVVKRLTGGITTLFSKHGIEMMTGWATFTSSTSLRVTKPDKTVEDINFEDCIIAVGSKSADLKGFPVDNKNVVGSRDGLCLDRIPEHLVVIGGGYIGCELAITYAKIGSNVTIVEYLPRILAIIEPELTAVVEKNMRDMGITFLMDTAANGYKIVDGTTKSKNGSKPKNGSSKVIVTVQPKGSTTTTDITCDIVLVAVGRKPNTMNLGLDKTTVKTDKRGFILHDKQQRTDDPHIWVIGDAAGEPMLAHKASAEGKVAAEAISGLPSAFDHLVVPAAIFTDPEIATVGLTAAEATAKGYETIIGKFPFAASGRAMTTNSQEGFINLIAEKSSNRVLGCHIVGPHASDIISEAALAIEMGATLEDISLTIHPHPTLPETLMEAADAALGKAVNIYQVKD